MFQIALDLSIHNVNSYGGLNNIFPIKTTVKIRFVCVLSCTLGHFYRFIFSYRWTPGCRTIGDIGENMEDNMLFNTFWANIVGWSYFISHFTCSNLLMLYDSFGCIRKRNQLSVPLINCWSASTNLSSINFNKQEIFTWTRHARALQSFFYVPHFLLRPSPSHQ